MQPNKLQKKFICLILIGVLVFILLFVAMLNRSSFCPIQSEEWASYSYQYSTPQDRGTQQSWKVITQDKKSPITENRTAYEKQKYGLLEVICGELKFTDLALVLFTYCLVIVGLHQMRITDETVKRSERAILFVGKIQAILFPPEAPPGNEKPWPRFGYNFANLGRTAAIIDRVEVGMFVGNKIPPNTGYSECRARDGERVLAAGESTEMYVAHMERHFTPLEIEEINNGKQVAFMFGFVRYDDIFGYVQSYSFCFQYHPEIKGVAVSGGEQYNFRHTKEKKYEIG